jgi:YgiT-type zinc finger domain-containing protein
MNCVICRQGALAPGHVTVTLQRDKSIIIIKGVPADVCQDCGEYYLNESVASIVYAKAEDSVHRHAEVEILQYAA